MTRLLKGRKLRLYHFLKPRSTEYERGHFLEHLNTLYVGFVVCVTVLGLVATPGIVTAHEIGPDLTYIAHTRAPHFIVESILNPRAYIAPEYETPTILTIDGEKSPARNGTSTITEIQRTPMSCKYLTNPESCG